jgi:hypothetical protein
MDLRRSHRPVRKQRRTLARAGTPHRPVAIPHGHPVRPEISARRDGLTCTSWFGKFHLEMHWWHGVHWPLWGRSDLFERSLSWYTDIMPAAKAIAERQGYAGVRWPRWSAPTEKIRPPAWAAAHLAAAAPDLLCRTDVPRKTTAETLKSIRILSSRRRLLWPTLRTGMTPAKASSLARR